MVVCYDPTGLLSSMLSFLTTDITGSLYFSSFVIAILMIGLLASLGVPLEYTAIILLPLHLAFLACIGTDWLGITGMILVYLGVLLGKNLFFRS